MGVIYLIRHGQASFGADDYDVLSDAGHQQARVLGASLLQRGVVASRVYSGAMKRHQATALSCQEAMGLSLPVHEHRGFDEFDHQQVLERADPRYVDKLLMMGEMAATGDPRRAFQAFFRQAVQRWVAGEHEADYQESWAGFRERCLAALNQVASETAPSGTSLVFTSGGVITAVCQALLHIPDEHAFTLNWTLVNSGLSKLVLGRQGMHLLSINEHSHLEGEHGHLLSYR